MDGQTSGLTTDGRANTAYCELFSAYFAGTDVFMSLHKPIITLTPFMSLPTVFMQNISP